jgi:hypothetical protein
LVTASEKSAANNGCQPVVSGWAFGAAERAEVKAPPRTARQRASERRRMRECGECMGELDFETGKKKGLMRGAAI